MTRSLRTPGHQALMQALVETRKSKGITQQDLANRLDRPQSYIAKVETGERRLDVIEFIEWSSSLGAKPNDLLDRLLTKAAN
ncbi:MAG: helix-turn-helix transcriptional regulator [Paracoccaceae bacterium]|nr:helix-turn-helix transcriptional regulator [Paracoccaceae bacterium]